MFLIYAVILSLFAFAFVVYPFLRSRPEHKVVDRQAENLRAFNQQINELKQAFEAGEFDVSEREQMENELKLRLLEDTKKADNPKPLQTTKPFVPVIVITVVTLIASFGYFYSENNLLDLEIKDALEAATHDPEARERYMQLMAQKLADDPDDIEGWWVLGQTYLNSGEYAKAVPAYEKALMALERLPEIQDADRSALMTSIVQAKFYLNDRMMAEEDRRMLAQAIRFNPENRNALGLSGSVAFESGNYAEAIIQWRRLGRLSPMDAQSVISAIGAAEARLTEAGLPIPENEFAALASGPSIVVSLDLAPELTTQALKAKAIYVLARVAGGPPMPVAVKQLQTTILPVQVLLDASAAMGPMAGLQSGTEIEIVARLSMTGSANSSAGDLQAISAPILVEDGQINVSVVIDTIM